MQRRLNLALLGTAGALALVLTLVRESPFDLGTQEARAAPGKAVSTQHDLSALKIFNMTLVRIKDRYVDPSRVDPKKMLYAALDSVQLNIAEVLVEPDAAKRRVKVTVNDRPEVFETDDVDSPWRLAAKLKKVFKFIETNMNAGADLAKVEYAAVNGMLGTLDPHSILMDPEQARDMDVSTSGKFGGLGIVIRMIDRKLTVIKPMKDTPASRAGIKAGDHIVRINGEPTENLTSNEAVDRMRGDPKTKVTLWVERKGEAAHLRFELERAVIRVTQVEHKLFDKTVGYIKVKQFSKGIANDVADAMRQMTAQGATSWILDLRHNPGGLLEEAVQLSDLFVDSGTIVTTVSGRDREARRAERGFGETNQSLALLVNNGSASASEIVAGALKNLDRAVIIGTRTFGKGTVQELYDNEDRSKLKLTIAQYLTPGDRSIQNLGIVPDIALQRMYVPEKNDAPEDFVRLLPPTRTWGEKDLDATLVSTYAKDIDKPAYELPFIVEKKKPTTGTPAPTKPDDDDDGPDEDDITEDFEIRFAKELVGSVSASTRPKLVAGAGKLISRVRAEEEKKLIAALGTIGVDWSAPLATAETANLDVSISTSPKGHVQAGEVVSVTATVKNNGSGTAYRVLPRLHADDGVFDDTELPVGKVAPGETKTFTSKIKVSKDAIDRYNRLSVEVREARNAPARTSHTELRIDAAPRPVFAYAYQLIDDGNGDGLVQRGEKFRLLVQVRNTGAGPTQEGTVLLRNSTGDGVVLSKSRFELKDSPLAPGAVREIEFPISTDASLKGDQVIVELVAYDTALDVSSSEKLRFKLAPPVLGGKASGEVTTKAGVIIRAGASEETGIVGTAAPKTSYTVLGTYGDYTKVKLGASRVGFIQTALLHTGGTGGGAFAQTWNSTPPIVTLTTKGGLETNAESYKLSGTVNAEQHVEDVYIFVANQQAKVETRKVFYRSNRGAKDERSMKFDADLPLWPGSNYVTVVARSNTEVKSTRTMYIYRDPPRTAEITKP
ncbi:MAG: PDZ domain-containing protein [Deltaproteobacteria bacterium]|nr:PDZ domain-containing protein [Deltaproteobacteria bacterium]